MSDVPFAYFIAQNLLGSGDSGVVGISFGEVVAQVLSESTYGKEGKEQGGAEIFHRGNGMSELKS